MYSWLVTVLLLASVSYCSGGQGAEGLVLWGRGRVCTSWSGPVYRAGASYTCSWVLVD